MTKRDFEMRSDGLGIGLFAIGVFCAVLVCQALFQGVAQDPGRLQMLAAIWVNAIGPVPSLAFQATLAGLGARLFLGNAPEAPRDTLRHVVGAAFVCAGLSILLGAFSATAGGMFGDAIGGALATRTHAMVGALVGLAAMVGAAWFVWLRPDALPEEEALSVRNPDEDEEEEHDDDGISAAEAEALLPIEPARAARVVAPPSPYPEDVRRRGEIPAGTRAIAIPAADAAAGAAGAQGYRWTAPAARKTDAEPSTTSALRRDDEDEPAGADDRYTVADEEPVLAADAPVAHAERTIAPPRPAWEDDEAVDAYGTPRSLVEALRREPDAAPEAPEAGSGTLPELRELAAEPIEVVEELSEPVPLVPRAAATPAVVEDLDVEDQDEDEDENELDSEPARAIDEPALAIDEAQLDDAAEDEAIDDADDDQEEDEELAAAVADLEQVEAELAQTEEAFARALADLENERPTATAGEPVTEPIADVVAETELRAEPAPETPRVRATPVADLDTAEAAPASTLFAEAPDPSSAADPEPEPVAPVAETPREPVAADPAPAKPSLRTLFDAPGPEDALAPGDELGPTTPVPPLAPPAKEKRSKRARPAPDAVREAEPETLPEPASSIFSEATDADERDVVLVPPAAPAERAVKTPAATTSPRSALLAEVGCLFIDRGRVAVSMLQRQYSMDFDEACKVLDELQDMGLIGPYLGGQRRDILLSRDAWLERLGSS